MRGQWFYCDDGAATRYVWFHSVRDLVGRAIEDELMRRILGQVKVMRFYRVEDEVWL